MKYFYTFTLMLLNLSFYAGAQSFSLSDSYGTGINDGDTMVVSGTVTDQILMMSISLMNTSSSSKTVKLRKTELSVVPGSGNAFAWGQLEYAPNVMVSQGNEISSTTTDSSFVSFYFPNGLTGISFIQYSFFDQNNPADSAWAVVKYEVVQFSGIADIIPSVISVFPNPVHGLATILLPSADVGEISVSICNLHGEIVYTAFIEHGKLSIDASHFPTGCYMIEAGNARFKLMKQ